MHLFISMHFHSCQIIYLDNNIQFINQPIANLCTLIPQCRAQSEAAEKRRADTIITLEKKRIEAIHALEIRFGQLRALIPVYNARNPTYKHVLAKQIIDIDHQLIEAKSKNFPTHLFVRHPSVAHLRLPQLFSAQPSAPQPPPPQPIEINDMAGFLTERPRQITNLYCRPGQPIGATVNHLRQIKYLPLPNAGPDFDQTLS